MTPEIYPRDKPPNDEPTSQCTCPNNTALVLTAYLRGEGTACPTHRPEPDPGPSGEPVALNSDALSTSLAAKLGGFTTGATL